MTDAEKVAMITRHIGLLKATFSDCQEIQEEIDKTRLNMDALIDLTTQYHGYVCEGEECIIYKKEKQPFYAMLGPEAGLSVTQLVMLRNPDYADFDYTLSWTPCIGTGILFPIPLVNERLNFLLNFTGGYHRHTGYNISLVTSYSMTENDYSIKYTYLKGHLSLRFSPLSGKFRPYAHLGYGFYTRLALDAEKHETVHVYISGEEAFTRETITKIPVARNLGGVYGGIGMNIHVNSKMFFGVGLTYEQYTGYAGGEDYFNKTRINAINLQTGLYFRID